MSKIIKVGIVGYGMSAQVFHAPFLRELEGFDIFGFVERHGNLSREKYPGTVTFRSFESMLAEPEIDLVVVTTPNETHFPYTIAALGANKDVVLEKPFTVTSKQAEIILGEIQRTGRCVSVYHNRRYVSDFKTIVHILKQQWLGKVVEYECHFDRYRPEAKPNAWREASLPGSGILYDLGSHLIDQALCLFGYPDFITADVRQQRPHAKIDDYFDIRLDFGETRAILKSSMLVREMGPRYMIHGTAGSYIKHGDDPQEALLKLGVIPTGADWGKEPEGSEGLLHTEINGTVLHKKISSFQGNFGEYYRNLYETLINQKPLKEKPEHGYNTIKIIELAMESSAKRCTLPVTGLLKAEYPFGLGH